jgi:uncharacterized protein (TIRG00374 family)
MFRALGYQPGFGPLVVACAAANLASAIPLTPGGLGVIEVTLVAITVGFGATRATAVLAVLGYRVVNYWLRCFPARSPTSTSCCTRTYAEKQSPKRRHRNDRS